MLDLAPDPGKNGTPRSKKGLACCLLAALVLTVLAGGALLSWKMQQRRVLHLGATWPLGTTIDPARLVAVARDGRVLTGSPGEGLTLRDPATGNVLRQSREAAFALAISPDGARALVGSNRFVWTWDLSGDTLEKLPATSVARSVAFFADGRRAVSGQEDGTVTVWDLETRTAVSTFPAHARGSVDFVAVTPDGKRILSAGEDGALTLSDAVTGAPVWSLVGAVQKRQQPLWDVALSPDGTCLASRDPSGRLTLGNLATGASLRAFTGLDGVTAVAFSSDGKRLAVTSADMVWLFGVTTGNLLGAVDLPGGSYDARGVAFSPDGRAIFVTGMRALYRIDVAPEKSP
jgi:WD40 repeat protein